MIATATPTTHETARDSAHAPDRWADRVNARLDRDRLTFWAFFTLLYLTLTSMSALRPYWFDELFTLYISRMDVATMWAAIRAGVDQHLPTFFLLARLAQRALGPSEWALRVPEMLAVWLMLLCLYIVVRRRATAVYGWCAVILAFLSPAGGYASEARPYGLLLGFAAAALCSWQALSDNRRRLLHATLLAASLLCAVLSHAYSVLIFLPLVLGELARTIQRRRIDRTAWLSIVLPGLALAAYIPVRAGATVGMAHTWAPPTLSRIPEAYLAYCPHLALTGLLLVVMVVVGFARRESARPAAASLGERLPLHELVALVAFALLPVAGFAVGRLYAGFFTSRYTLTALVGICPLLALAAHRLDNGRNTLGLALLAICFVFQGGLSARPFLDADAMRPDSLAKELGGAQDRDRAGQRLAAFPLLGLALRENLPVAAATGIDFLPFDYYGSPELRSRLVYLRDVDAAVELTNVDLFDRIYPLLQKWFPIRSRIVEYRDFIGSNSRFLVYGTWDSRNANDWLVNKLLLDGAQLRVLGRQDCLRQAGLWEPMTGDMRYRYLFEVTIPAEAPK